MLNTCEASAALPAVAVHLSSAVAAAASAEQREDKSISSTGAWAASAQHSTDACKAHGMPDFPDQYSKLDVTLEHHHLVPVQYIDKHKQAQSADTGLAAAMSGAMFSNRRSPLTAN